ncbi:MAG: TonB-dependent receptor [Acidobacteria bacterium]|nr:TonB-dependent receptor [Acidobacteriota bacterium]
MNGVIVAACLFAASLFAQEFRATLSGRITDAQDAVVAGVKLTVIQVETGAKFEAVSGADGLFAVPFLPPSTYRVIAEAQGFKRYQRENVIMGANERIGLDIQMEVGAVTETVNITAEAPILQTATASSGQVINTRQIESMPVSGRTPLALAQLAFGVTPNTDPRFTRPFDNAGPSGFSMGGAPAQGNELLIDGAPDTTGNLRVAYNPPMDAVAEVKAESFQADAAYGHTGGGTVNVILKSGTNNWHGSLYEFNQNSAFNATPFFTNKAGSKKPISRFNQYGGSVSGPVTIPKVFNGRDKLFFFFSYEGLRDALPAPSTSTVPTPAQRGGDFSALLPFGPSYAVYDPATGVQEGTRVRRTPFANNIIPANRLSPIAKNYLQFYPDPNQPGRANGQDNYLSNTNGEINSFYNYLGRLDFNLSEKHKFFFNARHNFRKGSGGNGLGKSLEDNPTATNALRRINWGFMLDDVYTLSPSLIMNTRLNWTRFSEPRVNFSEGFDSTSLGFPASLAAASPRKVIPRIRFNAYTGIGDTGGTVFPFDIFQIFESFTKIAGKHTLKFGFDLREFRESNFDYGYSNGDFMFGSNWTVGPLDNAAAAPIGQDLATFLLGLPTAGAFDINAARTNTNRYYAAFLQDDFRVRPNLTLNIGLRYEAETPTVERYDRSVNGFDGATANPISAAATAAYARNPITEIPAGQFKVNGGLTFAGGNRRGIYETPKANFSPRFGFAWTPGFGGGKNVIRGGIGLYYFNFGIAGNNNPGFSQQTPFVASLDGFLTPSSTLANPFPTGVQQPTGSRLGLGTFLGRSLTYFNEAPAYPYSARWQISIQRELSRNSVLEVGYMANKAVKLAVDHQLNWVPLELLSRSLNRDQPVINRMTANVANPYAGLIPGTGLNGSLIALNQLVRPYSQFTGVTAQSRSDGQSHFHAMQVRYEKRFSQGFQMLANFQWSKLIEKRSRLNDADPVLEKRIAAEDRPYRLVVSSSYDLPFGKGKHFLTAAPRALDAIAGGWQINGIYTIQPGSPLGWGNVIYFGGPLNYDGHRIDGTLDTTQFNRVPAQQLDWNVRTFPTRFANLRADSVNQLDFSIIKAFHITEKVHMTYRCEFFNSTNRPIFSGPNLAPTNSNFGIITNQANQPRRIQMALRLVF